MHCERETAADVERRTPGGSVEDGAQLAELQRLQAEAGQALRQAEDDLRRFRRVSWITAVIVCATLVVLRLAA